MTFQEQWDADKALIDKALKTAFRERPPRADLYDAMNYSLLAPGKRLRPILVLESCHACGAARASALPLACAIEMIHTYSLIHDDLPCMDDDDLRRGRPTNHKVYGEATAVLAGDGLLTAAFETALASPGVPSDRLLEACRCLAGAAGAAGMVGGQALDMAGEGHALTLSDVEELQALKTGALIQAAVELGCILAGGSPEQRAALCAYAQKLGRAFQIRDDILDVTGTEAELGKPVGSDAKGEKTTFVTLKGLDSCAQLVSKLTAEAVAALAPVQERAFLEELARRLAGRTS